MSELTWKCKRCGKKIDAGRVFCSKHCQSQHGWKATRGDFSAWGVERGGLPRLQAELSDAKAEVKALRASNDTLFTEKVKLEQRVVDLEAKDAVKSGQIATLEERQMEQTIAIRDLTRTLRALERKANEGENWKGV